MRQTVSERFLSMPFTISTILPCSSTRRWRLRLPSVSAHSSLRSLKVSPLGFVISEVSTLRRARSWMVRSSPSYAKRPSLFEALAFILRLPAVECQNGRHHQLPHAVRNSHGPGGQRLG